MTGYKQAAQATRPPIDDAIELHREFVCSEHDSTQAFCHGYPANLGEVSGGGVLWFVSFVTFVGGGVLLRGGARW